MQEALPDASKATRVLAGDLITTTLSAVGKQFSERPRTAAEIAIYAEAMADMFCAYLERPRTRLSSVTIAPATSITRGDGEVLAH